MTARNSAAARAEELRASARLGVWRRVLSWLGLNPAARRADAQAALWAHGAAGEEATVAMLRELEAQGWHVRHDLRIPGRRFNLDHVLVSPCGTAVVVLDSKAWDRRRVTSYTAGRVLCGAEDRHKQVVAVAGYARMVAAATGLPTGNVLPLVVVHGSPVAGGFLSVPVGEGVVHVVGPAYLVPSLRDAPSLPDVFRAGALAGHVFTVLRPYGEGAGGS